MKITKTIRTGACLNSACPGFLITDDGTVLVQGRKVDVRGTLKVPNDETVVAVPQDVFADLVRQYAGQSS